MQQKPILTVADLQREFLISKNTAYNWVNQEGFPALRLGRAIRIPRQALEVWVAEQFGRESEGQVADSPQEKGRPA